MIKTDTDQSINVKSGNSKSAEISRSEEIPDEKEILFKGIESKLRTLLTIGEDLDDELIVKVLHEYLNYNLGYLLFVDYASNLDPGKIPSDLCLDFANAMIDGGWKDQFIKSVMPSADSQRVLKVVIFLARSLENDYPTESKTILDLYLSSISAIEKPDLRAGYQISIGTEMHLAGFDRMPELIENAIDLYIDSCKEVQRKIQPVEILNLMSSAAAVDYDLALKLRQNYLNDDFLFEEGNAAASAGLMKSEYEKGGKIFLSAMNEILKSEYNPVAERHTPFEYAFSILKEDDREKHVKKFFDVMKLYNRLNLMPPVDKDVAAFSEPEFPAWYRDSLFEWMNENYTPDEKVMILNRSLAEHCARYPKSGNTEVFIGWALDWIDELENPYDRYISLGRYLTMHNGIIPDNIAIARPRIFRLIDGFKGKVPDTNLFDSLLEVVIYDDPYWFKELLGDGSSVLENTVFISGFTSTLIARHYLFDKNDAGLASVADSLAEELLKLDDAVEFKIYSELASIWAGWDDDKAWEYIELMDEANGRYPAAIIDVAIATKHYAPGFASRCVNNLLENYQNWEFKLSSPNMEDQLVEELAKGSITWAEQLADIITQHRGNIEPVYSYYSLREIILRTAYTTNSGSREIIRISNEIQDQLREDLFESEAEN